MSDENSNGSGTNSVPPLPSSKDNTDATVHQNNGTEKVITVSVSRRGSKEILSSNELKIHSTKKEIPEILDLDTVENTTQQYTPSLEELVHRKAHNYPENYQPAIVHTFYSPLYDAIDPARPLDDIPDPAPRFPNYLSNISLRLTHLNTPQKHLNPTTNVHKQNQPHDNCWHKAEHKVSKWDLINSPALAEHLQLLQAGELARFPDSFYKNNAKQPLLSSLKVMQMLSMMEIRDVLNQYPTLVRAGFLDTNSKAKSMRGEESEIQNSDYADDWEVILFPHLFDDYPYIMASDILACSIVKHVLLQSETRKSVNTKVSLHEITHAIRSYQLSQCKQVPLMRKQLRRVGIYPGHVILVAYMLGLEVKGNGSDVHCNLSSRASLLVRYPIMPHYYINGWS